MGLKDRIEEEMVVDTESMLEEYFDTAKQLFQIFEDGTVDIAPEYREGSWKERVLIHLIGQRYAFEGEKADTKSLSYDFFYASFDKNDSTIRKYVNKLQSEGLVKKEEESGAWMLVPQSLPTALNRIEDIDA